MSEETIVRSDDGSVGAAYGASKLISTIVSSIVLLVLLGVGLYALHMYLHWF